MIKVSKVKQTGFTLLELMVAISIFAVMSIMIFGGLREVLNIRSSTEHYTARLTELQVAFMFFSRDARQLTNRTVRTEFGDSLNALQSNDIGKYRLELTSAGYPNPAGLDRSTLQRVAYGVEDNKLYRYRWNMLDRAVDSEPVKSLLLSDVSNLTFRFLDATDETASSEVLNWTTSWPPLTNEHVITDFPKLIEITLELEDWGRFTRIFILPEVY